MNTKSLFATALNLQEPWYIKGIAFSHAERRLDLHIDFKPGSSFPLEGYEGRFSVHDTVDKSCRHLNFFQHECYLHCRTPRVNTPDGLVRLADPPWAGKSQGFTLLFEALLMQLLTAMPVAAAAKLARVSDDKLWRMLEKYIELARHLEDFSEVKAVGMDETSRRKGHQYVTLFVDLDKSKTLYVAEGKDAGVVPAFLIDFTSHGGKPENIRECSMDMSPAFISAVESNLPEAEITFDRFHIMKILNAAVDEVRRAEVINEPMLKDTRYVLLKNRRNLTSKQRQKLYQIEAEGFHLKSYRAMQMREYFQEAFKARSFVAFRDHLNDWFDWAVRSKLPSMVDAARTLRRHWDGILNWYRSGRSNGILEGINSLVQAAKAKARGYRTVKNLRLITYLVTAKLDFSKCNPDFAYA